MTDGGHVSDMVASHGEYDLDAGAYSETVYEHTNGNTVPKVKRNIDFLQEKTFVLFVLK